MTSKIVLDCETFETALVSLASAFQATPDNLHELLSREEIATYFETNCQNPLGFKEYVYAIVERVFGSPLPLDEVCWFHTTRILPGTTFSEGILPLGAVFPSLKEGLIEAIDDVHVREQVRSALDSGVIADFHYCNKTQNQMHWGPYAILVKEVAFHSERLSQHDYLGMPEIIEDICNGFQETSGIELMPIFREKLKPAIVKFVDVNNDYEESYIATALSYVYSKIHEDVPCGNSVACFDGKNNPVLPQHISNVEFVV